MIDTGHKGWQGVVVLGLLLACETARTPSSEVPASEAVLPASGEHSAAGAAASVPGAGGASAELNGGIGGNAPRPAGSGASGVGGNDTGSGGTADGGASGSSGASGRDADPSSGDEQRYAVWLGPAANAIAAHDGLLRPRE